MTAAILLQTLVTVASLELAFAPHPQEAVFLPPKQEVLAATVSTSTPTPTPTHTPLYSEYITESGDTLARIAKNNYGSEKYWVILWNDNEELSDPTIIHPGLTLRIRTQKPDRMEEPNRPLPSPTPTPTQTPSPTPTPNLSSQTLSTGSTVGNFSQVYVDAGNKYGTPWQILYAIHKVETGLGDGPIGYEGGPQGPMQFMPGTWAVYGVDGNGDGNADINNAVDAIHSAANYLSKHGSIEQGLDSYGKIKIDVLRIASEQGYSL